LFSKEIPRKILERKRKKNLYTFEGIYLRGKNGVVLKLNYENYPVKCLPRQKTALVA
jgi:hypothetical protein